MSNYHRYYIPNSIVALTLVTYNRQPIFADPQASKLILTLLEDINERYQYECVAYAIMPDHLHLLIHLSLEYPYFSIPIRELKRLFSINYQKLNINLALPNPSRQKHHEVTVWQRRFWDHVIKDECDLQNHINYIHFNPVKHGLTDNPADWQWSSFSDYVEKGYYPKEWLPEQKLWESTGNWGE